MTTKVIKAQIKEIMSIHGIADCAIGESSSEIAKKVDYLVDYNLSHFAPVVMSMAISAKVETLTLLRSFIVIAKREEEML